MLLTQTARTARNGLGIQQKAVYLHNKSMKAPSVVKDLRVEGIGELAGQRRTKKGGRGLT